MKKTILCLSALAAAATILPLAAQTAAPVAKPPVHTTTGTVVHKPAVAATPTCAKLPVLSDKIPALPAGTPCAKALYTLTKTPDTKVDYVSPLVSPEVRDSLGSGPTTFSLAYIDVLAGTGELVKAGKFLSVKYTGYLVDGTKFDSSEDHPGKDPISFPYGQHRVIQGWDTGFEGMHIGGKRRVFIPYQLAYGDAGKPPVIPAKSMLVFDIEVVSQSDAEPKKAPPAPRPTPPPAQPAPDAKPATPPASTTPPADAKPATPPPASTTPPPATTTTPPPTKQ